MKMACEIKSESHRSDIAYFKFRDTSEAFVLW